MASSSRIERKARVVSEIDDARRKPVFRVKKKKKNNRRDERKVRYTNLESIISRRRKRSRYSHSPSSSSDEEGDGGDTSSSSTEDEDDNPFKEVSDDSPPFTNEIAVDVDEMYEIEELCKTNSACIRAVHILEVIMLSSGLSLTMDYNGQTILPNEVMQKVFRVEWGQKFIHDLLWHLFMFGFAVVNGVDSNISEGEVVPMVCEKSTYMLCFIEKFDDRREYRVYPMDEIGAYEAYGYDRGKSRRRQENMDKNVGVYIMNAPMSNGHLSSKFASIIDDLIQVAWCKLNFSKTDYNSSNWPVFMEDVPSKGDKASPLESAVAAGENALECFLEEQYAKFEDQHRANVDGQAEAYARAHSKHVEQLEARGFYGKLGKSRFASDPPYVNRFMPGIGRRFANVSAPPLNPHLIELTEKLESTVSEKGLER